MTITPPGVACRLGPGELVTLAAFLVGAENSVLELVLLTGSAVPEAAAMSLRLRGELVFV